MTCTLTTNPDTLVLLWRVDRIHLLCEMVNLMNVCSFTFGFRKCTVVFWLDWAHPFVVFVIPGPLMTLVTGMSHPKAFSPINIAQEGQEGFWEQHHLLLTQLLSQFFYYQHAPPELQMVQMQREGVWILPDNLYWVLTSSLIFMAWKRSSSGGFGCQPHVRSAGLTPLGPLWLVKGRALDLKVDGSLTGVTKRPVMWHLYFLVFRCNASNFLHILF